MYGPGITQPPPRPAGRATVIWLRVLFAALPVVTLGFFAWASPLRLALVRKNPLDWVLMGIDVVLIIAGYILVGVAPNSSSWQSNVGTMSVLVVAFGTPVYFLIEDIRHRPGAPSGYGMPTGPYGYAAQSPYATGFGPAGAPTAGWIPGQASVHQQTPMPNQAPVQGRTPVQPQQPQASAPSAGPVAAQPQAPRIEQVRAELDELSDYLRKEEGP